MVENQGTVEAMTEMEWIKFLGVEAGEVGDGLAVIRMEPKPVHLNHNGTVNAAVLYGLAEVAGAGAFVAGMIELAAQAYTVVERATIEYLAPARGAVTATGTVDPDEFAAGKAKVTAGEPASATCHVEIADAAGRVAAKVTLITAIRPRRR